VVEMFKLDQLIVYSNLLGSAGEVLVEIEFG